MIFLHRFFVHCCYSLKGIEEQKEQNEINIAQVDVEVVVEEAFQVQNQLNPLLNILSKMS